MRYKTGVAFEIAGFIAVYLDIYDNSTDVTRDIELKAGSTKISEGYKFTQAGLHADGDCYTQTFCTYIAFVYSSGTFR